MLGLGSELQRGDPLVGTGPGEDDHLGRPGGKIDRDVAQDEELGLVHVRTPWTADLVHARDRLRSVREAAIAGGPPRDHTSSMPRVRGRGDKPRASGGVATTIRSTPATRAGTAHITSVDTRPRGT